MTDLIDYIRANPNKRYASFISVHNQKMSYCNRANDDVVVVPNAMGVLYLLADFGKVVVLSDNDGDQLVLWRKTKVHGTWIFFRRTLIAKAIKIDRPITARHHSQPTVPYTIVDADLTPNGLGFLLGFASEEDAMIYRLMG